MSCSRNSCCFSIFGCGCCKPKSEHHKKKKKTSKHTLHMDNDSLGLPNTDSLTSLSLLVCSQNKSLCPVTSLPGDENGENFLVGDTFSIPRISEQFNTDVWEVLTTKSGEPGALTIIKSHEDAVTSIQSSDEFTIKLLGDEISSVASQGYYHEIIEKELDEENDQHSEQQRDPLEGKSILAYVGGGSSVNAPVENQNHDELTWVRTIQVPDRPSKFPYYVTSPVEELHRDLFAKLFQRFVDKGIFYYSAHDRQESPYNFHGGPQNLRQKINLTLPHHGVEHDHLLEFISHVITCQPHQSHRLFMKQNAAGLEPYSCIGDIMATCINSNTNCYLVSAVTTLMEMEIIRVVCQLVGYAGGGDGLMIESTLAIGYVMKMAMEHFQIRTKRHLCLVKKTGLSNNCAAKRPCFFVNERAKDAYLKCAIFQGWGLDAIIPVATQQNGKMDLEDLQSKIDRAIDKDEGTPLIVVGTACTPIVRAIDELDKIAGICEKYQLWFHVDATYGGGALLCSDHLKHKLKGVERSDSFSWSQNILLGVPCISSCLVVASRHKQQLANQYAGLDEGDDTGYAAFIKTPLYEPQYNMSGKHLLSSKRSDMFKVWLMWKAKGTNGLGYHVDHIFRNAQFCLEEMKKREGFHPVIEQFEGTNVCFWYVPNGYRGILCNSNEYREKISRLMIATKRVLLEQGNCVLSFNELPPTFNKPTFLIIGLHNSAVTKHDITYVLDMVERTGEDLSLQKSKFPK